MPGLPPTSALVCPFPHSGGSIPALQQLLTPGKQSSWLLCLLCLQVTLTADPDATCTQTVFPLTYTQLPEMVSSGDSICVARYLATGADKGSLFLEVGGIGFHRFPRGSGLLAEAVHPACCEAYLRRHGIACSRVQYGRASQEAQGVASGRVSTRAIPSY